MERRRFLQTLGIGAAGLYTMDVFAATKQPKKLAVQLFSVREFVAKDLKGSLEKLAGIGYNEIEIYGYNGTFFGKSPGEFKQILKDTGITVSSSHHTTGWGMKGKGTLTDGWKQAVEDLHSIGAKYMGCSYLFPQERTKENYTALPDLLSKSGEVTKDAGIQFFYHNHDFEFEPFNNTLVYDHILQNTTADLCSMELDLYWITKAGKDPLEYFGRYPGRFALWHVKDMEAGTKDITEVGHGTIDFDKIFAAREQAGLQKWFVEQDTTKGDIFQSLKESYDYLSKKKYV